MGYTSMLVSYYEGSKRELGELLRLIVEEYNYCIVGYRVKDNRVSWGEIHSLSDLPLDIEDIVEPGRYQLVRGYRFRHSFHSPKYTLNPPIQELICESRDFDTIRVPRRDSRPLCLFGIKPCDLASIRILDLVLRGKHPTYTEIRDKIRLIVVEECVLPNKNCFCSVLGTGPTVREGFDIAYARLDSDVFLFKAGSSIGLELLERAGVREASVGLVEKLEDLVKQSSRLMHDRARINISDLESLLEVAADSDFWSNASEKCIACGNCNFVCPTCFCMELEYHVSNDIACKKTRWTGCLVYSYGLVAGGHFRPERYMRYRHFLLHKFSFYKRQIGMLGCVGCGRCITWCPIGLDHLSIIKQAISRRIRPG